MSDKIQKQAAPLTQEEFLILAERLDVDPSVLERLYPMVRDLLVFAGHLNALAPELGHEIDRSRLSLGIGSTLK